MNGTIKAWVEIKGDAIEMVLQKQLELRKNGSSKKNIGIVVNQILNEHCKLLKSKI